MVVAHEYDVVKVDAEMPKNSSVGVLAVWTFGAPTDLALAGRPRHARPHVHSL